jgi:hypothetical protein
MAVYNAAMKFMAAKNGYDVRDSAALIKACARARK